MFGAYAARLLIALGVGYAVLYLAKREEKGMRLLGLAIGTLIIVSVIANLFIALFLQSQLSGEKARYYNRMMMQQPRMAPKMPAMPKVPAMKR